MRAKRDTTATAGNGLQATAADRHGGDTRWWDGPGDRWTDVEDVERPETLCVGEAR